ncbi:hypothetical protein PybrP1_000258 [[Pythium] brassicae (nom. inval.)]|nr:hypothetical protein PybrP1_000258 [[Pythium] brassicae (nom. inval.)]
MSTLTSSQLHVKRSSTRLHAPPGGVSSISFGMSVSAVVVRTHDGACWLPGPARLNRRNALGPGGLGTVEVPVMDGGEKAMSADPAGGMPPSRMGGNSGAFSFSNNNNVGYDYAPPSSSSSSSSVYQHRAGGSGGAPGGYGSSGPAYSNNNNSNTWGQQQQQQPTSSGRVPGSSQYGATPGFAGRPFSGASSGKKKRRQWLARKNGGSFRPGSATAEAPLPMPPGSVSFGNPWDDVGANAPPSPLSKFMHQQSQKQSFGGGGGYVDYERIRTAAASPPPPTSGGSGYPRDPFDYAYSNYNGGGGGVILPSRCGISSASSSTTNRVAMSQFTQQPPAEFGTSCTATPASRGQPAAGRAAGSAGGVGGGNWAANRSAIASGTARQPPGGHSNWSPFS